MSIGSLGLFPADSVNRQGVERAVREIEEAMELQRGPRP